MSDPREQLERLISRCLDGEADATERQTLQRTLREDPHADALFEEYAAIDREAAAAVRAAVAGSTPARADVHWLWREAGLALAACVALLLWLAPPPQRAPDGTQTAGPAAKWFAPPPTTLDTWTDEVRPLDRAAIPLADTQREWIVVPGQQRGEYLVIEVNRTKTRMVRLKRDF